MSDGLTAILTAIGLIFVIEGGLYALFPEAMRRSIKRVRAPISHQGHGLRGTVRPTGKERRAARCRDIGQAHRRSMSAGERRPSGRAQAPARGVAGLNRSPRYAFRPAPGGSNAWCATQAVTLVRNGG